MKVKKLWKTALITLSLLLAMSVTAPAASLTAEAASTKQARSVAVKVGSKKVTKKTYTIVRGKSTTLKVVVSPSKAKRSVSFKSSNKKIVTVSKKGKIKAKKTGTAKISITVKDKTGKKKATWVKVKVKAPLKAPSKTSVSSLKAASASSISVKWKKPSRAKGYQVQIAKNSKFTSGRKTYKTTKTGKTISGLSSGQRYYVRVRAYNKSGSTVKYGKWSSVKKVTTKKLSTPSKSSISSLSATGTSSISVKWKKSSNAKGYQVQAAKNSGFTSGRKTYTTTGLSKSISGLSSGQKYYVRVRAYNKSGSAVKYSGWSSVKTVTTKKATTTSGSSSDTSEDVSADETDTDVWEDGTMSADGTHIHVWKYTNRVIKNGYACNSCGQDVTGWDDFYDCCGSWHTHQWWLSPATDTCTICGVKRHRHSWMWTEPIYYTGTSTIMIDSYWFCADCGNVSFDGVSCADYYYYPLKGQERANQMNSWTTGYELSKNGYIEVVQFSEPAGESESAE